jgi:hypothetical protein
MNLRPRLHWQGPYLNRVSRHHGRTNRLPIDSCQGRIRTSCHTEDRLPPKDIGKDQWRNDRRIGLNDKLRCLDT